MILIHIKWWIKILVVIKSQSLYRNISYEHIHENLAVFNSTSDLRLSVSCERNLSHKFMRWLVSLMSCFISRITSPWIKYKYSLEFHRSTRSIFRYTVILLPWYPVAHVSHCLQDSGKTGMSGYLKWLDTYFLVINITQLKLISSL